MKYLFLSLAIVLEVVGSSFMKASDGFSKLLPTAITIVAYIACFFFLSQALKSIPLGIDTNLLALLLSNTGIALWQLMHSTPIALLNLAFWNNETIGVLRFYPFANLANLQLNERDN